MNKNKNQAIIVIISIALSIIPIVSPLAVYAEETTQGQDTQQTTYTGDVSESVVISNSDGEKDIEKQENTNLSSVKEDDKHLQISKYNIFDEIKAGFDSYVFSNDTTEQDVKNYFKQILDDMGVEYTEFFIVDFNKTNAKEDEDGGISFSYSYKKGSSTTISGYFAFLPSLSRNDNIELSEATFEDRIFREFITNTYDLDSNGYLSLWELTKINEIDVSSLGDIGSLKGIEYLSWLKLLDCSNLEKVTALDISRNVYLETLDCSRTGITAIDVSQNPNLASLSLNETRLIDIDVSQNHSLTGLRLENTGITTLDVSNNPNLRSLRIDNTPLMSLNVGEKANYEINLHGLSSNLNSNFLTNTFNIKDMDKNIDLDKITMGNNGTLDKTTGIISGYSMDQPIEYSYFCGKDVYDYSVVLNVKIELAIEINEKNFPDHLFRQYISNKIDSAYTNDSRFSASEISKIDKIDLSDSLYKDIKNLEGIEHFTSLEELQCQDTEIKSLNLSKNSNLRNLVCDNTGITSLDLSNNHYLSELSCTGTPLAWLTIGQEGSLHNYKLPQPQFNVQVNSSTFDITKVFEGIDPNNVTIVSGAKMKAGIVSEYKVGTPVIYEYHCGKAQSGLDILLRVELNLTKSDRTLEFTEDLNVSKLYTGKVIDDPKMNIEGAIFTYEIWNGTVWESLKNEKPINVGKYRVTALLPDDGYNNDATASSEFTIAKADNEFTTPLTIENWTYGEEANKPVAIAKYGTVKYTYSDSRTGVYSEQKPSSAGTYYVKAAVKDTVNYKGLESIKEFTISKADNEFTTPLTIENWTYGEEANKPIALAKYGTVKYTYSDSKAGVYSEQKLSSAGTYYVKATVKDTVNYKGLESIKEFTISKADNEFTTPLTIENWTYGEEANKPVALAKYGTVKYTYSDSRTGVYTDQKPRNAGTYYVKATVKDTVNYKGLESIKEFTISKAVNEFTTPLTIENWTYGEEANKPVAISKYGTVKYTYSDLKAGVYTDQEPRNAGTYYVKATVEATVNYKGLESICSFVILPIDKENNKHITISDMDESGDVNNLIIKDGDVILEKGVDYDVEIKHDGSEVNVIIVFKGNYTGMIIKNYKVNMDESDDKPIEVQEDEIKEQSKEDTKIDIRDAPKTDVIKDTGNVTVTGFLCAWSVIILGCAYLFHGMKKDKKVVK